MEATTPDQALAPPALQEILDLVLTEIANAGTEWRLHLQTIARATGLPKEIVRAACRELRDRGLAVYSRGLFTDDLTPAGAGYGPTNLGARIAALPRQALSIRQPWAWAIVKAGKDIENRTWSTSFRGPICLHASAGMTAAEYAEASAFMLSIGIETPRKESLERGGIVAVASIAGCVTGLRSPWFSGPYGFVLQDVCPVPFIPCKGSLGFFDWRAGMSAQGGSGRP
jgi:hypothetical protein